MSDTNDYMLRVFCLTFIFLFTCCSLSVQKRGPASEIDCFESISSLIHKKNSLDWVKVQFQNLKWKTRRAQLSALSWFSQNIWESPRLAQGMAELMSELKLTKLEFDEITPELSKSKRFRFDYRFPKVVLIEFEAEQVLKKEIIVDQIAELFQLDINSLILFKNNSDESLLTKNQWSELSQNLKLVNESDRDSVTFDRLIPYLSTLPPGERAKAISQIHLFFEDEVNETLVKQFRKKIKKFDEYSRALEVKFKSLNDLERQTEVLKALKTYEKLSLSCRSKGQTLAKKQAAKNGTKFFLGVGLVSTSGSYFYNNWDKEKNSKWYGNLGYDVVTASIFNYAFAKILGNNQSGFGATTIKSYATFAGLDFLSAEAYSHLFGVSESEAGERLNKILEQPQAKENLEKMLSELEAEDIDSDIQKMINEVSQQFEVSDLSTVLELEELREKILEAISLDMYYQDSGEWIRTGDKGMDRYLFHRAYDTIGTPKGIAVGMVIFNILCRDAANPKNALAKALSLYIADKVASDFIYYKLRRKAINL